MENIDDFVKLLDEYVEAKYDLGTYNVDSSFEEEVNILYNNLHSYVSNLITKINNLENK